MYDVIVVGSGFGGIHCAARLAKGGKKVLVLEKMSHLGGTGYLFHREGYGFPMGPLSFSSPRRVRQYLDDLGVGGGITYRRNHFQLLTPSLDIVYSLPLDELREELKARFPRESGVDGFFAELRRIVDLVRDEGRLLGDEAAALCGISSGDVLGRAFSDPRLRNLLGTMGTTPPTMSMLNLGIMWNAMSVEGVWFPSCGVHGVLERLGEAFTAAGGELRLNADVREILIEDDAARGVRLSSGEDIAAKWVVSNADYKKTFLELVDRKALPVHFYTSLRESGYTTSELCVYLGVDPTRLDMKAMRATHLFYLDREGLPEGDEVEDFGSREIEICRFSDNAPALTPPDRASLVLRVDFPFERVAPFRTGEKKRGPGYREDKERLVRHLAATASHALPGLDRAVEVTEAATPLTYADWGCRHQGSIAGWSWKAKDTKGIGEGLLVRTPVEHMLMVGIYASSDLFLGGVPTAMRTGAAAADLIMGREAI